MLEYVKGDLFDHALLVGMSSDEYWFGDPSLIYNYESAFELKQRYDLQMAWTLGAYFKSALGSTQVWTVQPMKTQDWRMMPKYAENPLERLKPKKQISEEKRKLMEETRQRLASLGLLRKDK